MVCEICSKNLKKNSKRFCSKKCEKDSQYNKFIEDWKNDLINGTVNNKPKPSKHIYRYFRELEQICSVCKMENKWNNKELRLEIDHIDGDRFNNSLSNLRLICPNCHSQTNTFRNKKRIMG